MNEHELARRLKELGKQHETAVDHMFARLDDQDRKIAAKSGRFASAQSAMSASLSYSGNDAREVLTDFERKNLQHYEAEAKDVPTESPLSNAANYAVAERWFKQKARSGSASLMSGFDAEDFRKADRALGELATVRKDAMAETSNPLGGYTVPTIVEGEVARLITDNGKVWPKMRQLAMRTRIHNVPDEQTSVVAEWVDEAAALTENDPVFGEVVIEAEKLACRSKMSVELVQDNAIGLLSWLLRVYSEKMARELDFQAVLGDGTSPELLGVYNGVGINPITESTQAALTFKRLASLYTAAGESYASENGVWIMSPNGYSAVIGLSDSAGNPVVQYGTMTQDAPAGRLLGRPILVSGAVGGSLTLDETTLTKTNIIFGPPSAYCAGTRMGMTFDVTEAVGWVNYQMDARLVGRFGGRPTVPAAWSYLGSVSYP